VVDMVVAMNVVAMKWADVEETEEGIRDTPKNST